MKGIKNGQDIASLRILVREDILCEAATIVEEDCGAIGGVSFAINYLGSSIKQEDLSICRRNTFWYLRLRSCHGRLG